MDFRLEAQKYTDPERMAADYLVAYFGNQKIEYPINPFTLLKDEGVLFTLSNFHKLEGVYVPAASASDIPIVGINANRPITRQRLLLLMNYAIISVMLASRFLAQYLVIKPQLNILLMALLLVY